MSDMSGHNYQYQEEIKNHETILECVECGDEICREFKIPLGNGYDYFCSKDCEIEFERKEAQSQAFWQNNHK